ncbi:MAG TPA: hypothetical protein V6C90_23720 [Coleofasciculaceae cyanobacterium]|jgi:hypothetical protein
MVVNTKCTTIVAQKGESMPLDCYEKVRRRRDSAIFNLGYCLIAGGAAIVLANPLLFLSGNVSAATATTAGGLASVAIVYGRKLCKDADDRLDDAAKADEEEIE